MKRRVIRIVLCVLLLFAVIALGFRWQIHIYQANVTTAEREELELLLDEADAGMTSSLHPNQVVFFHHIRVIGEQQSPDNMISYYILDQTLGFENKDGSLCSDGYVDTRGTYKTVLVRTEEHGKQLESVTSAVRDDGQEASFPRILLYYDRIFGSKEDLSVYEEADRRKAQAMINGEME